MGFYLRHSIGFFLQLAPSVYLCLIPFGKEAFHVSKKLIYVGYTAASAVLSLFFPIFLRSSLFNSLFNMNVRANLYMFLAVLLSVVSLFFCIQEITMKKVMVIFLALIYALTQYIIVNLIGSFLPADLLMEIYSESYFILFTVSTAIMFPLCAVTFQKVLGSYIREVDSRNMRKEFNIVTGVSLAYVAVLLVYVSGVGSGFREYWWVVTPPLLFTVALLLIFYWFLFQETLLRKKDNEYQKTVEIQQLQYQSISREIENARRNSHDMKHYLQGMYELLERGQVEEAKERLTQIVDRVDHRENENYCANTALNLLLQYYAGLARDENILFEAKADCGELTIPNMELTTLFGNILENAIYSCRQVRKEPRIDVNIGVIGDSLMILISNSCEKVYPSGLYRIDTGFLPAEAFASGKQGGGYGLKSITMTVQKYRGEAGFQFDERTQKFTTRIRINLHPEIL